MRPRIKQQLTTIGVKRARFKFDAFYGPKVRQRLWECKNERFQLEGYLMKDNSVKIFQFWKTGTLVAFNQTYSYQ